MNFIEEWNEKEMLIVESAIKKYFRKRTFVNHRGEHVYIDPRSLDEHLGLAYVSSGAFALLTLDTNEHLFHPEFKSYWFSHAAISKEGMICLVLSDDRENEIVEEIANLYEL